MTRKSTVVLLGSLVGLLALSGAAFAMDQAAPAQPAPSGGGGASTNFFVIFFLSGGGVLGVITTLPIVGMSIWSIAIILQYSFNLNREKLAPPEIVVQIDELIEQQQYEEALNICDATRNYITAIVGAALAKMQDGADAMGDAAAAAQEEQNILLSHKVGWLTLLSNVAPMCGLFGTVVGMVQAFTEIATSTETPSPQQLASGIFTALITTVWGLIVAIPSMSAGFIFKNRLQRLTVEMGNMAAEMIERLKPAAGGGK
jgi:biopolymer transport protein ExbB